MSLAAVLLLVAAAGASADVAAETAHNIGVIRTYMGVESGLFARAGGQEAYGAEQNIKTTFDSFFAEEVWCTQIGGPGEGFRLGPVSFQKCLTADDDSWQNAALSNYVIKSIAADVNGRGRVFFTESAFDVAAAGPDGKALPGTRRHMTEVMKLVFDARGRIVEQHAYSDTFLLGEIRKAAAAAAADGGASPPAAAVGAAVGAAAVGAAAAGSALGPPPAGALPAGAGLAGALALALALAFAAAASWSSLRSAAPRGLADPCLLG